MYRGKMQFREIPEIGFAMRHYSDDYKATYGGSQKTKVEIAYINTGKVQITFRDKVMYAEEGSVLVLFRHLPVELRRVGEGPHSHDTLLAEFEEMEFTLTEDTEQGNEDGMLIPFITPPSAETEKIGRKIRQIARDMAVADGGNALLAGVGFLEILKELHQISDMQLLGQKPGESPLAEKMKEFLDANLDKKISLTDLAEYLGKTPNYAGHLFQKEVGMRVSTYVNTQKIKKVADLFKNKDISFEKACEAVSIYDKPYGYRLFKKYMGITPAEFRKMKQIKR